MALFATEFPVKNIITKADFAAQAICWVKGMQGTRLFDTVGSVSRSEDGASIYSENGEKFYLKDCDVDGGFVVGARHEIPDGVGRIWRSEVILTSINAQAALRSRTQCILTKADARIQVPKKPYFIKLAIDDGWADRDGDLGISQDAIYINDDQIDLASDIVSGVSKSRLPILFISRSDSDGFILSDENISYLSFRLSGVAHVVVEPSRRFSIKLMNKSSRKNPYGGSIGICISGYGVVKRFYMGEFYANQKEIIRDIMSYCYSYVTNRRTYFAWEWQDILEEISQQSLIAMKNAPNEADQEAWYALREEENQEKDIAIKTLKDQIDQLQNKLLIYDNENERFIKNDTILAIGPELYCGEFDDRIKYLLIRSEANNQSPLSPRMSEFLNRLNSFVKWSGGATRLADRIKAAGKDSGRADQRLAEILIEIGFEKRHQAGHPVLIANDLFGVPQQTLSNSSSDIRAGRNAAAQIIRDLELAKLDE